MDATLEDTTPLRAYLKPGEKKKQRMVPVIQLIDDSAPWQNVAVMQTAAVSSFSVNSAIMEVENPSISIEQILEGPH